MPQLHPSPTLMLPAVGAAPWQGPLSSQRGTEQMGKNHPYGANSASPKP